ncbi:hypothetical protein HY061_03100 [Candidatus Azambacteria bacterium]|nr:hypothetical protein [Candidatus Azambacteria bacterium]
MTNCFYCGKKLNKGSGVSEDGIFFCKYSCEKKGIPINETSWTKDQNDLTPQRTESPFFDAVQKEKINNGSCDQCERNLNEVPKDQIIKAQNSRKFCGRECRNLWYGLPGQVVAKEK